MSKTIILRFELANRVIGLWKWSRSKKMEFVWFFQKKRKKKWPNSGFGVVLSRKCIGELQTNVKNPKNPISILRFLLEMRSQVPKIEISDFSRKIQIISSFFRPRPPSNSFWALRSIRVKIGLKMALNRGILKNRKIAILGFELENRVFGLWKWSRSKKTGNYLNFSKTYFLVDLDHFGPHSQ